VLAVSATLYYLEKLLSSWILAGSPENVSTVLLTKGIDMYAHFQGIVRQYPYVVIHINNLKNNKITETSPITSKTYHIHNYIVNSFNIVIKFKFCFSPCPYFISKFCYNQINFWSSQHRRLNCFQCSLAIWRILTKSCRILKMKAAKFQQWETPP